MAARIFLSDSEDGKNGKVERNNKNSENEEDMEYVALTGAAGLLGSYLLKELLRRDIPVLALIRSSRRESAKQRIEGILRRFENQLGRVLPRPVIMECDLHKPELGLTKSCLSWLSEHVGSVIHCAASLSFTKDGNGEPYRSNVDGLQHVLQVCQCASIRKFFHVSTCYVCGLRKGVILESELDEGQAFANDYEKSKVEAEKLVRSCRHIDCLTVFRPAIIVGDRHTGYTPTFHGFYAPLKILLPFASPELTRRDGFLQFAYMLGMNPEDHKNFVPVDWSAAFMAHVITHPEYHGKTYHLASANRVKICEMGEAVCEGIQKYLRRDERHTELSYGSFDQLLNAFASQMEVYRSYWKDDPEFDMTNTRSVSPVTLQAPEMTREVLLTLVQYAIQQNCGWPLPRVTEIENDVEARFQAARAIQYLETQSITASLPGEICFGLRVSGRGGGDWTVLQKHGMNFLFRGLPAENLPLMTMNSLTFSAIRERSSEELLQASSWEDAPLELKKRAIDLLKNIL